MKIALVDVDGHNFPNLALMKLAAWHKAQGDRVEWYAPLFSRPDKIYASKIFTYKPDYIDYALNDPEPIRGGTGYDVASKLPAEVEQMQPDYSIYPTFTAALGFSVRGCPNSCPWCVVPEKEGALQVVDSIERIAAGRREVVLLDNNLLASCKWIRFIRFSCDTAAMIEPIRRAARLIREAGSRREIFCYMLVQDIGDAERRLRALVEMNISPFAQPYRDFTANAGPTAEQRKFAAFANVKGGKLCNKISFKEYYH